MTLGTFGILLLTHLLAGGIGVEAKTWLNNLEGKAYYFFKAEADQLVADAKAEAEQIVAEAKAEVAKLLKTSEATVVTEVKKTAEFMPTPIKQ